MPHRRFCRKRRPALLKNLDAGSRDPHRRSAVGMVPRDQSARGCLFPHRQPRARRPPRLHRFDIGSLAARHPLEKIEDQGINCVHESTSHHCVGAPSTAAVDHRQDLISILSELPLAEAGRSARGPPWSWASRSRSPGAWSRGRSHTRARRARSRSVFRQSAQPGEQDVFIIGERRPSSAVVVPASRG